MKPVGETALQEVAVVEDQDRVELEPVVMVVGVAVKVILGPEGNGPGVQFSG